MILYEAFYRKYGVRKLAELLSPRTTLLANFDLPKNSILHYLPQDETDVGIAVDDEFLPQDRMVFVNHSKKLTSLVGSPRATNIIAETMARDYHQRYRRLRKVKKVETALRDPKTILVENHALLGHLYRYTPSVFSQYNKWFNVAATFWKRVEELAEISDRQQYVVLENPLKLPLLTDLKKAESNLSKATLNPFSGKQSLFILDIWLWLSEQRERSALKFVSGTNLSKVNVIWKDHGRWFVINLGLLQDNLKSESNQSGKSSVYLQKAFLRSLMGLMETRTVSGDPVPTAVPLEEEKEETKDLTDEAALDADLDHLEAVNAVADKEPLEDSVVSIFEQDVTPDVFIGREIDLLADQGRLTGAEYRRLDRLKNKYKNITPPEGEQTFEEFLKIDTEELKLEGDFVIPDSESVIDKGMLKSTVSELDPKYINQVMQKDVANVVMSIQKAGLIVEDYSVERIRDAVNDYNAYTVKVVPVNGSPTTLRFKLPHVKEDGTYKANGVSYKLRRQRGDLPIRKVSPSRVALTSYYGKVFVERAERSTNNYEGWLLNQIVSKGLDDEDTLVTDMQTMSVFDHLVKVPRLYSTLAKRLRSFKLAGWTFFVDYAKRESHFGADTIKSLEKDEMVVLANKAKSYMLVDNNDTLYVSKEGKVEVLGKITELLEIEPSKIPTEIAELKVFNKPIPVGLALGYLLGIETLIKRLKLEPRRIPTGTRLNLTDDEYALKFADETLVFSRDDRLASMIMGGYNRFAKNIRDYSTAEFNKEDVYLNVLENNGIHLRYVRELNMLMSMFVDHITKELLVEMEEPDNFIGLLFRSCELLMNDEHPKENDIRFQRIKSYERLPGTVYGELVRSVRSFKAKPANARNKVEINPQAVWQVLMRDPAQILVEGSNPIHNLKEKENLTFAGHGGRSSRSMVAKTRVYDKHDVGVISEGTVDNSDVAIHTFLSPDANLTNMRGLTKGFDYDEPSASKILSTASLVSPASDRDD